MADARAFAVFSNILPIGGRYMEYCLYDAPTGVRLILIDVPQELRGLGFIPGTEVSVLLRTRGGVSVRFGELTFAICRALARKVVVRA